MRCLDSLGIKPQLHVFWTGADSVWWEWRPQVEWKCFPSNDLLRSRSGQCHLVIWTNCPTVEHCAHPWSDWEKHLSYRVDPLWGEHNHNVKQVRLNSILLLSFPGGMMLICSSAKVLFYSSAHVTWTGGEEKFTEIKENVKRTGITLQHGKCDNVSKGAHWAQLTDTHDTVSHNSSLMVESNVEERPSLSRMEAHPMTHDLANLGNPQPCPSLSLNWQPNLFVSNHWRNSNVKVNQEEGLTRKNHDISNLSLFPCFL